MKQSKDLSLLNCIATSLLAIFFTVPVHESFHLLTDLAYGDKVACFSAGAVQPMNLVDYSTLSTFHKIMLAGGSASILNAIIGVILLVVLLRAKTGALLRVFLIQLMGCHLTTGFGYFMIGGFFGSGDWGLVFARLSETPGVVTALRVALSLVGSAGVVGLFFLLNYFSYDFIENKESLKERTGVGFRLHLLVLILGFSLGMLVTAMSPAVRTGELSLGLGLLYNMMWIPFFWGFMFTGVMKTLPPKGERFLYKLPREPHYGLWGAAAALTLVDIFVFGPGIWFN